jgi:hypothetical protein
MEHQKRWVNETLQRLPFETIFKEIFARYKDNLMCSQETIDKITLDAAKQIREQLQGISRINGDK